jgi:hypothetical integral membrane protein (TIGR02206 family)
MRCRGKARDPMNQPLDITPGAWTVFAPYTWLHGVTVLVCLILIATPSLFGRRLQHNAERNNAERTLRYSLAAFAVAVWLAYNIWWNWHGIDWRSGLPLQLCDINGLMAPFALVSGKRWARATLYFWTAALTAQAFIQPALIDGPAFILFWAFWIDHTVIAACAVYDVMVRGFRPLWRDLGTAVIVSLVYVALVLPVDLWLGADYGFVGNPPSSIIIPPFVLALGPWPQRALVLIALVPIGFVIVLLPWLVARARQAIVCVRN